MVVKLLSTTNPNFQHKVGQKGQVENFELDQGTIADYEQLIKTFL